MMLASPRKRKLKDLKKKDTDRKGKRPEKKKPRKTPRKFDKGKETDRRMRENFQGAY
jgi:hypothetical protein